MNLNFRIWGPISVRRKDITSLVNSKFGGLLQEFIADLKVKFKCQCDSAYINSKFKVSGGGRGMASVRDVITSAQHWKCCDYKERLRIRNFPVAKTIFVCLYCLEILLQQ